MHKTNVISSEYMCLEIDIFTPRHDMVTNTQWLNETHLPPRHICDKLEWFSNKAENRKIPGITWLNLSKCYRTTDLSDRFIAFTKLKDSWNRWSESSTCHHAAVQAMQKIQNQHTVYPPPAQNLDFRHNTCL